MAKGPDQSAAAGRTMPSLQQVVRECFLYCANRLRTASLSLGTSRDDHGSAQRTSILIPSPYHGPCQINAAGAPNERALALRATLGRCARIPSGDRSWQGLLCGSSSSPWSLRQQSQMTGAYAVDDRPRDHRHLGPAQELARDARAARPQPFGDARRSWSRAGRGARCRRRVSRGVVPGTVYSLPFSTRMSRAS